jgi:GT2 family glycosyltransferase
MHIDFTRLMNIFSINLLGDVLNMEEDKNNQDHVSILICSRNRRKALENLCSSLLKMHTKFSFKTIVVEETDDPIPIEGTIYVSHPVANRGIPFARSLALSHATGDLTIFLDDDCVISSRWLDNLLEPFKDGAVVAVQGGVTVPSGTNAIGWAESILGFPGGGIRRVFEAKGKNQETKEISTLNCVYRKSLIEKVGGFDERLKLGAEDYLLAKQVCRYGRCLFVPKAIISHESRGNLTRIWHWFVRRGRAEIGLIRTGKQRESSYWTVFKMSLSIKILSLLLIGLMFSDWIVYLIFVTCLLYFFLQYLRYYKTWKQCRAPRASLFLIPIVKLTMDGAMDYGRVWGIAFD